MIGAIETKGGFVPFHAIDCFLPNAVHEAGDQRIVTTVVQLRDGSTDLIAACDWDALQQRPLQIMPALPGWRLVHLDPAPREPSMCFDPIIAWALCFDGEIRPVTPGGVGGGVSEPEWGYLVETPHGGVVGGSSWGDGESFPSAQAALDAFSKRYRPKSDTPADG